VVIDPHGDRVAARERLVQHLDPRTLDEPELDQPPLQLAGLQGSRHAVKVDRDHRALLSSKQRVQAA